jgi:hypothetical protein
MLLKIRKWLHDVQNNSLVMDTPGSLDIPPHPSRRTLGRFGLPCGGYTGEFCLPCGEYTFGTSTGTDLPKK